MLSLRSVECNDDFPCPGDAVCCDGTCVVDLELCGEDIFGAMVAISFGLNVKIMYIGDGRDCRV